MASGWAQTNETHFGFPEFFCAPLRIHLLQATNAPAVQTTLTSTDVERILTKINRVWAQAGISFYLESLRTEEAFAPESYDEQWKNGASRRLLLPLRPLTSEATNLFHLYYLKHMTVNGIHFPEGNFVKDTASLRPVTGGIDEPLPRVSSHELGHALTLPHRQNTTNLMASGTTGTSFDAAEISQVRQAAEKLPWIRSAPKLLETANTLFATGQQAEAELLYRGLALLPGMVAGVGGRVQPRVTAK